MSSWSTTPWVLEALGLLPFTTKSQKSEWRWNPKIPPRKPIYQPVCQQNRRACKAGKFEGNKLNKRKVKGRTFIRASWMNVWYVFIFKAVKQLFDGVSKTTSCLWLGSIRSYGSEEQSNSHDHRHILKMQGIGSEKETVFSLMGDLPRNWLTVTYCSSK